MRATGVDCEPVTEKRITLSPGMEVTKAVHLVRPLGEGGMGAVWLGEHTGLKTTVVVKFMVEALDTSTTARSRFSREAAAAAQVKSPHVVQMLDHGVTDDGMPFIVMEHLEGKDLSVILGERGKLEPREVVVIVSQVAKALSKVHAAGLLHRDIKPSNIFMVDGEDEIFVKLLDFGIAKAQVPESERDSVTLDGETKTGQIVGTPFYMSPEQVTAQKVVDHRSDLWALGVVTWELLVGSRPFDGPSFGALAVAIASGPLPPLPAGLPQAFEQWFAKACARDLEKRFATARQMSDALRAAFESSSFSLPPATPLGDSSSGQRPKPVNTPESLDATLASPMPASELAKSEPGAVAVTPSHREPPRKTPIGAIAAGVAAIGVVIAIWSAKKPEEKPAVPVPSNSATAEPPPSVTAVIPVTTSSQILPAVSAVAVVDAAPAPVVPIVKPPPIPVVPASSAPKPPPVPSAKPRPSDDPLY